MSTTSQDEVDMGESPPAPIVSYQQFHDLFVIRGSVQAFKCNYETGDVEFWLFGGGNGNHPLKTWVTPKDLKEALQAFSEGRDWQAPDDISNPNEPAQAPETYQPNDLVVAKDRSGNWYCGQILNAAPNKPGWYKIAFTGFGTDNDEVKFVECIRRQLPYPRPPKDFPAGTKVLYCDAAHTYRKCFEGKVDLGGRVVDKCSEAPMSKTVVMALL